MWRILLTALVTASFLVSPAMARPDKPHPPGSAKAKLKWHKRGHGAPVHKDVVVPRRRHFRNIVIVRPHGHSYHGYGHYYTDDDAFRWLAFTAITLKVLDVLNEEQERRHEAAQIQATTAPVGNAITWSEGDVSGSVTTTREGTDSEGHLCREFLQEVTVGGKTENAYGTACLQPDGSWKIVQ